MFVNTVKLEKDRNARICSHLRRRRTRITYPQSKQVREYEYNSNN